MDLLQGFIFPEAGTLKLHNSRPGDFLSATEYHSDVDLIRGGWGSSLSSSLSSTLLKMGELLNALTDLLHILREVVLG